MADTVFIGHARASETGTKYGEPGNQNGKELRREQWYPGFTSVIRAKAETDAEAIAKAIEQAVDNKHVGYSQETSGLARARRTGLYDEALKKKFNIAKVSVNCNCDCSSLVSVAVNAAGIEVNKNISTANLQIALERTKKFDVFANSLVLDNPDRLRRGDILLKPGHCAVVLNDGRGISYPDASKYYPQYKGNGSSLVDALNSLKIDSSKAHRLAIAHANNIPLYAYTAEQNNKLLSLLKQGKLRREK